MVTVTTIVVFFPDVTALALTANTTGNLMLLYLQLLSRSLLPEDAQIQPL